jgi:hypothetical protein
MWIASSADSVVCFNFDPEHAEMASPTTGWGSSMSAETTPAQGFPTPCTRCGGVLYQHVDFCPYCGADNPLDKTQRKRAGTQLRAVDTPPPAPEVALDHVALDQVALDSSGVPSLVSPDIPVPQYADPQPLRQTASRWIATRGAVLLLFIGALGYAGYLLLGDNHRQDTGSDENTNNASTSGGSISPYAPQPARNMPTSNVTNVPPANNARMPVAPPRPPIIAHHKDVPDALRTARAGLAHSNLSEAKAAISDALSIEPDNAEALQMQSDLKDRENQRDVALNVANTCAKDKLWTCVRERASQALSIDVSSPDAQALLERVILSTGWKPLTGAAAPAPRGATPPANVHAKVNARVNANATEAGATNTNANTNPAPALPPLSPSVPAEKTAVTTNETANPAASDTTATSPAASSPASAPSGIDAQMRAILDSGWKHAPSANKQ